jgi:hypothetical protein
VCSHAPRYLSLFCFPSCFLNVSLSFFPILVEALYSEDGSWYEAVVQLVDEVCCFNFCFFQILNGEKTSFLMILTERKNIHFVVYELLQ